MVDTKPKFQVSQEGNPRGKNITINEIKQCINDLKNWFQKNCKSIQVELEKTQSASSDELKKLSEKLKLKIPESIDALYQQYNGNFQLFESFKTLTIQQILENLEHYEISGYWNKSYIPFAVDSDNNVLIVEVDNGQEVKIISWNTDIGVVEVVNENFGLYIERLRDGVLKKLYEYIEDVGLVEVD